LNWYSLIAIASVTDVTADAFREIFTPTSQMVRRAQIAAVRICYTASGTQIA
jgi:ABC-type uncharacterized transport system substrate-binding protein